ncbi:5-methylcytosine restriction system specificity protein McrC [Antrihabitans cavernicola]|uniref:5-methylcytosine restriction system specificity protein McrC n=1 Tax=Antrihabitans cavernicola TaxID=2495913 RepID=UPI0016599E33|nr:hypothetical protein [Spelaeibacter cavernicola]
MSLADGHGGTVTVTILPKMWSLEGVATSSVEHAAGTTTHVKAYELDFLNLRSTRAACHEVVASLAKVTGVGEAKLIESCPPPKTQAAISAVVGSPFADLIALMNLADKSGVRRTDESFTGLLDRAFTRLLTQERFLRALEPLLFKARPRYIETTGVLTSPKGRLHDKSLMLSQFTGQPWVTATFDDLTMDTPVLQVVNSALHVVASDRLPAAIRALNSKVEVRAVQFARHLTHVSRLPRERALLVGERLWLSALERQWQPVVEAALDVLRRYGPTPADGADSSDSFVVHVFSEKFWEQVLHESLNVAFRDIRLSADASPGEGIQAPGPWRQRPQPNQSQSNTTTLPDFMFRDGARVVLADAKYKRPRGISAQDGYQLFAYSHLASLDGATSEFGALIYPGNPSTDPRQDEWWRRPHDDYALWSIQLPFPNPHDLATAEAWSRYIARTARAVRDLVAEWTPAPRTAAHEGVVRQRLSELKAIAATLPPQTLDASRKRLKGALGEPCWSSLDKAVQTMAATAEYVGFILGDDADFSGPVLGLLAPVEALLHGLVIEPAGRAHPEVPSLQGPRTFGQILEMLFNAASGGNGPASSAIREVLHSNNVPLGQVCEAVDRMRDLKNNYRNPAAHKEVLNGQHWREVYDVVVGARPGFLAELTDLLRSSSANCADV